LIPLFAYAVQADQKAADEFARGIKEVINFSATLHPLSTACINSIFNPKTQNNGDGATDPEQLNPKTPECAAFIKALPPINKGSKVDAALDAQFKASLKAGKVYEAGKLWATISSSIRTFPK